MPQMETTQLVQLIAWIVALIEFILGLYILLLNFRNLSNRYVSGLLIIIAVNTFAQGLIYEAKELSETTLSLLINAATTPAIQPGLLLAAVVLLKPEWLRGRWKRLWWIVYGMIFLPIILTIVDYFFNTSIWYTGYNVEGYTGGFINLQFFTEGFLGLPIRIISIYFITLATIFPTAYVAFFDKSATKFTRNLAVTLLVTQILSIVIMFVLFVTPLSDYSVVITSLVFVIGYTYVAFWQLIYERRMQSGRLQIRLSAVILSISIPLLIAVSAYAVSQAGNIIRQSSINRLEDNNNSISTIVKTWFDQNNKALDVLVKLPDIISMDTEKQKPVLESMAETYDYMYLVSTLDLTGFNVARNDDVPPKDYSDRAYYRSIISGDQIAQQTLIGKTSGQPALVVAKPIKDETGELLGVGFYASTLETLSDAIKIGSLGRTGIAFIVDSDNQVIAHPDPEFTTEELRNFTLNPAVSAMRNSGTSDPIAYQNDDGIQMYAYYQELENGWGVIIQQEESDFLGALSTFQFIVFILIVIGVVVLGALTMLAIRQAVRPIESLTETAAAIREGDFSRVAPLESDDEIGELAQSFNQMTQQLLESIDTLEQRVVDRTEDLEVRSIQLQTAAEVGRAASSILDVNQLILEVVEMIRGRFNFYYVGLFEVDDTGEWAYLRAGTGEAGKTMISRGHRIKVGEGMVGWSIANARSRIALEVEMDAMRLVTPELPETRSETAIPLQARRQVIGALTVQDIRPDAFDESTVSTLQTLADLVSVAIDNARLYSESQENFLNLQRAYAHLSPDALHNLIGDESIRGYYCDDSGTESITDEIDRTESDDLPEIEIPITIRGGQVIGWIKAHKPEHSEDWDLDEISVMETLGEQLSTALESAQLFQETQNRMGFETITREVSTRLRDSLDIETVIQTAAFELRKALDLSEVEIRMGTAQED